MSRREFPNYLQTLSAEVAAWHTAKAKRFQAEGEVLAAEARLWLLGVVEPEYGIGAAFGAKAFCCTAEGCDRPVLLDWSNRDQAEPLCLSHEAQRKPQAEQPVRKTEGVLF